MVVHLEQHSTKLTAWERLSRLSHALLSDPSACLSVLAEGSQGLLLGNLAILDRLGSSLIQLVIDFWSIAWQARKGGQPVKSLDLKGCHALTDADVRDICQDFPFLT